MNRYEYPYISDGVEYSAVIWAESEAEAAEKMRTLPWQPGNGPLLRPRGESRDMLLSVLLLFAIAVAAATALTFRQTDIELKQMATSMRFHHVAYPPALGKPSHRA